jgi:hypothetical protein
MPFRSDNDGVQNFGIVGATHAIPSVTPFGVIGIAGPDSDVSNIVDFLVLPGGVHRPLVGGSFRPGVPTAGVFGASLLGDGTAGVIGENDSAGGIGVAGYSEHGTAVQGEAPSQLIGFLAGHDPVFQNRVGAYGQSEVVGVMGLARNDSATGVYGGGASHALAPGAGSIGVRGETFTGVGVQGQSFGSTGHAGKFFGPVQIDGSLTMNGGGNLTINNGGDVILADCAEDFQLASDLPDAPPGSVMVLDEAGAIRPCSEPYDKCAVGVVSGAGPYRPAIVFDRVESSTGRLPISLVGKVCCMIDASFGPIEVGDLLTTSSTAGHAMKAADPMKAFGAVIGKALGRLSEGTGLVPILVALQ